MYIYIINDILSPSRKLRLKFNLDDYWCAFQVEKAGARTEEEEKIAEERRKAKKTQAEMELHEAKAKHAAEKLRAKQSRLYDHHNHHAHHPVVGSGSMPTTPLGKLPPATKHM